MEAAVVGVGKAALSCLLSGTKAAIADDAALRQSVQRDAVFLTDELAAMNSFLRDADEERNRPKIPRSRVKQVRDLAYDVEDCLQNHAVHLEKPYGWRLARTVLERHRIAEEMKGLRARVEDLMPRNLRYRHLAEDASSSIPLGTDAKRQDYLFFESGQVDLVPLICTNDQELRVIVVCGTSGDPWKTTIVRKAYDDLNRMKFECHAWVRIMHPFNPSEFLHCIVRQFYVNSLQEAANKTQEETTSVGVQVQAKMEAMNNQGDLVNEFNKHVTQKSYLIVLNDLSTIEDWDWIKTYFPNNKNGSRIIVSTEQCEVASLCAGPERLVVELKQSSADQIIYAFCEKDFHNQKKTPLLSSNSNDATTSTNNHMVLTNEILGNQSEGGNERKMVTKSITRIKTMASALEESQLVGREKEKSNMVKLLLHQTSQELQVISVWGMVGIGKTTLVKDVYQSQTLVNMFEKRAFVTVLRPFILKEFLKSLVMQLTAESSETKRAIDLRPGKRDNVAMMGVDSLIKELHNLIKGKSCLIILDDLSSTTEWDNIKHCFPNLDGACRILVTTRGHSIAKHCSGKQDNICKLSVLEDKEALYLFTRKVFKEYIDWDKHPYLIKEAQLILKKCNGLPLAIVTIGGFLANQPKIAMEWRKSIEHISAELEMNPELEVIRSIFAKSYDGLPYHLKSCFLYLSIFPEDHKISRKRLTRRWVAEGYSKAIREKPAEEISNDYFMKLIDRSMILPSKKSFLSRTGIDSCHVRDLMREISISKSAEENLVFRLEESCRSNIQEIVRHLTVSSNWTGDRSEFENAVDLSRIRSLTVFGKWRSFYISKKMRLLRVLDLESTTGLVNHHLEHIGNLLHLKYISLRGCHGIYHLPDSWGNLLQLETLDITGTRVCMLPQTIIKLRKLQHLFGGDLEPRCVFEDEIIPYRQIELCLACCAPKYLQEVEYLDGDPNRHDVCTFWWHVVFPTLASRRLDPTGIVLPKGVRKLKNLRTLGIVNISRGKAILREIRRLTQLRKLVVRGVNEKNYQEFCSTVAGLSRLESLSVESRSLHGLLNEVSTPPSTPPSNLQCLKLQGKLVKLPEWIGELQNLVKLKLHFTRLSEVDGTMHVLGKLPNLAILQLLRDSFNGDEGPCHLTFCREAPFRSLKVLELNCICWCHVLFEEGAMPELELLRFYSRGEEDEHAFSGLATLPKLKEFVQDKCTYRFEEDVRAQLAMNPNGPIFKKL